MPDCRKIAQYQGLCYLCAKKTRGEIPIQMAPPPLPIIRREIPGLGWVVWDGRGPLPGASKETPGRFGCSLLDVSMVVK
jgi:hypothetical protein